MPMLFSAVPLPWGVAVVAALVGAVCDLRWRKIPNLLTLPTLLAGLVWAGYSYGASGLLGATAGCLLLAAPYLVLFLFAGGGAGDVKLMGALGAWLGLVDGAIALGAVLLCGVLMGLGYASLRKQLPAMWTNIVGIIWAGVLSVWSRDRQAAARCLPPVATMQRMPYGVAVLAGVCLAAGVALWRGT
jgi:prepilin peptidase CpaA